MSGGLKRILALLIVGLCCAQCGDDGDRGTNIRAASRM